MARVDVIWASPNEAQLVGLGDRAVECYAALVDAVLPGAVEIIPGACSVQICVRAGAAADATLEEARLIAERVNDSARPAPGGRVIDLPICSDPDLAPDLNDVARSAGLAPSDAADLHAAGEYVVRLLGFSPGFPYIDGLPKRLHMSRLDTPRPRVRRGSVGIAGARCGVYPHPTPGGWRLIGATPVRLFNSDREPYATLAPGDRVRFRRIDRDEFEALEAGGDR